MTRGTLALAATLAALSWTPASAGAQVGIPALPPEVAVLLPTASTCEVTVLDADSVKVSGSVDPNALPTSFHVEYGLAGVLDLSSATIDVGSLPDPTSVSAQLDDLVPGASYSCRIVALNATGQSAGSITTFLLPGSGGSGGSGATPTVNLGSGQMVPAGGPNAVACTLTGTSGDDRLKGTPGRDVICGLGGADRIAGLAGDDILIGGPGIDRIRGGAGKDRLYGNRGKDRLCGNRGKDRLTGGAGRDVCSGGRGADRLSGSKGRDRLVGGAGRDRLVSSRDRRGGDRVHGGTGRDRATMNRGDRKRSVERVRWSRR